MDPKVKQYIFIPFLIILMILMVFTSFSIITNPYTFPTRFWLFFIIGFIFYITVNMIENVTDVTTVAIELISYVIIAISILLNVFLITVYIGKWVDIPSSIVNVIVFVNGFSAGFILNYALTSTLIHKKISSQTQPVVAKGGGAYVVNPIVVNPPANPPLANPTAAQPKPQLPVQPRNIYYDQDPYRSVPTTVIPPALAGIDMNKYDFGAFDISNSRSDIDDVEYYTDYFAQYQDEANL